MVSKWGSDQTWWQSIIGHQNPIPKLNKKTNYLGFKFRSSSYLHQGFSATSGNLGNA